MPQPVHLCTDPDVLGAPFYLMQRVDGVVVRGVVPGRVRGDAPAERVAMTHALVDVLADLHAVDPAAVGLTGFGRPDGYLARQLRRWRGEWEALRDADRPAVDALAAELSERLPAAPAGPVVHGDYRLDNVMLDPADPGRVAAVLDWEMSTLGDPLADLGLLVVYWQQDQPPDAPVVTPSVTALPGFPGRLDVVERYAARTGRDVSALPWYVGFGVLQAGRGGGRDRGPAPGRRDGRQHRRRAGRADRAAGRGRPGGAGRVRNDPAGAGADRRAEDHPYGRSGATLGAMGTALGAYGRSSARCPR